MDTLPDDVIGALFPLLADPRGLSLTCKRLTAIYYFAWPLQPIYAGKTGHKLIAAAPPSAYKLFSTQELYLGGNLAALTRAYARSKMTRARFLDVMMSGAPAAVTRFVIKTGKYLVVEDQDGRVAGWLYRTFGEVLKPYYETFIKCSHYAMIELIIKKDPTNIQRAVRRILVHIPRLHFRTFKLCADILDNFTFEHRRFGAPRTRVVFYLAIRGVPMAAHISGEIRFKLLCALRLDDIIKHHYLLIPADAAAEDRLEYIRNRYVRGANDEHKN